ncbi:hypothetical protein AFL01nite_07950 [Aeromicrobium flavum]|uniref:Ppx/GppA phosphatase N-terminal domain-containing protein n=1 Tax=Aeromicrobium flavum TaxID=416568 RepID=A0A512HSM7_9ACTN|nr:Ppx/GppA phosphatase family protein [Aeromicrobium flavum]GEO88468.1 hypothetical protein AFL01nite_07950 [Aeromicrobium flavum]
MRIGVLDIGSNTGHLLIVDAFRGGPPVPAHSFSEPLRLAENLDGDGHLTDEGIDRLVKYVVEAGSQAEDKGAERVLAFATSAVREAGNAEQVIARVAEASGTRLQILPGEDEARLTFLAVRRWFGWSSGRLGVFDIGGGSLELGVGSDETPETAVSLPLGAGRLTREWLDQGMSHDEVRREVRREIGAVAGPLLRGGGFDRAVATSKTFRSLARMCGSAPSGEGPYVRRRLAHRDLVALGQQLRGATDEQIAAMPGVSVLRAHQMRAGAMVAEATMDLFGIEELEICPWALREGVLIEYLDHL